MMSRSQHLCLLCTFPVADSGIRVDAFDAEKLAEWCSRKLGARFEIFADIEEARSAICQFCIWEARLENENSLDGCCDDTICDWWTGHDRNQFFYKYFYKNALIQPCRVELKKMQKELKSDISNQPAANEQLHQCKRCATHFQDEMQLKTHARNYCQVEVANQSEGKFKGVGKIREGKIDPLIVGSKKQCNICKTTVRNKARLLFHVKKYHKNCIRCQYKCCAAYFNTKAEKQEHEKNVHTGKEWKKCIYCGKIYSFQAILVSHIQTLHKEAIRCDFHKRCATFFFTLAEKEEHILQVHKAVKGKMRCVYCSKMYTNKAFLRLHIKKVHAAVMIKCKFNRCGLFFLSQIDSDKHFQQVHQHLENFQCLKCGFITTEKYLLKSHIRRNHKQKKVKCNECQGVFWSVMNLRRHLPCVHSRTRSCDHCGLEMHRLFLISHLKIEKCLICSIELPCVSVAKLHSKTCR